MYFGFVLFEMACSKSTRQHLALGQELFCEFIQQEMGRLLMHTPFKSVARREDER